MISSAFEGPILTELREVETSRNCLGSHPRNVLDALGTWEFICEGH